MPTVSNEIDKKNAKVYGQEEFNRILTDTIEVLDKQLAQYGAKLEGDLAGVTIGKFDKGSKSAEWQSAGFANLVGEKGLEEFKKTIETAKTAISQIKSLLDSVKSLADLLSSLESIITDPLTGLATQIIKYLRAIIDNIKSTGIYTLDLTEPYYIGKNALIVDLWYNKWHGSGSFNLQEPTLKDPKKEPGTTPPNKNDPDYEDKLRKYNANVEQKKRYELNTVQTHYRYKSTTYEDFIQMTANAFVDENDIPDRTIKGGRFRNRKLENGTITKAGTNDAKAAVADQIFDKSGFIPKRTGKPEFGKGSISGVYILAIQFPDLVDGLEGWRSFKTLFGIEPNAAERDKDRGILKTLSDSAEDFKNVKWFDQSFNSQEVLLQAGNYIPISGGAAPDFIGTNLYDVFPGVFGRLEGILTAIEGLFKSLDTAIGDMINDILSEIAFQIKRLKALSDIINRYITLLSTLEGLSINVLKITSTDGNDDIYEQLLGATGFPLQGSGTKNYIFGFLMCVGTIDPTAKGSVDIQSIREQSMASVDEATGTLKLGRKEVDDSANQLSKVMKMFGKK